MFTNRISRYYGDATMTVEVLQDSPRTPLSKPSAPHGFQALPATFPGLNVSALEIYRQAYEMARRQAEERLLALLRSRWN